ncbi:MAG: lysophospholipid acyltransferase family protein [Myxococcota bacterium]|nr:lysophospholipid acyltransferase family protein [Myxococcota bacterium]
MLEPLKWVGSLLGMVVSFLYLALVINPIQIISVLIYPVSPKLCRRINRWCARSIWGWWVVMAECQNNIEVRITGDKVPVRENVFVTSNHQSVADIMVMLCFAWRCGRIGDMKWFVKDILKWIPGPGWGMYMIDCIFLKRNWARDKQDVLDLFSKFKRNDIPVFLVSFLEGTRATPEKLKKSQEYARKSNLPIPQATLVPRTKGFVATMQGLGDHLDAVYDLSMGYPDGVPSFVDCFLRKVRRVDIHVTRYPINAFEMSDEKLSDWVFARYREKDQLMVDYKANGAFPGEVNYGPIYPLDYFRPESKVRQ